jgi:hypothetical protein
LKQGFNLLKPQVEAPSVWTTIYKWVVGTARIILIITETAVIAALVIRIFIDVKGKDLDERIASYETIVSVRASEEKKYLGLQMRTTAYKESYDKNIDASAQINELIKNIPLSFSNLDMSIVGKKVLINGEAPNTDIQKMEQYLKSSNLYVNSKLITFDVGNQLSTFKFETEFSSLPYRQLIKTQ